MGISSLIIFLSLFSESLHSFVVFRLSIRCGACWPGVYSAFWTPCQCFSLAREVSVRFMFRRRRVLDTQCVISFSHARRCLCCEVLRRLHHRAATWHGGLTSLHNI